VRRLILILTGIALTYSCGGGGLGDADVHYRDFGVNVAVRSAPYLTEENHPDGWEKADCLGCHQGFKHTMATADLTVEQYQDKINRAVNSVGESNAINVCSACHGLNGVSTKEGTYQRKCLICHDNFERIHFYRGTGSRTQSLHDFNGNGRIDDFDCVVCHWQPDMDGIVEPDTDFGKLGGTVKYRVNDLCLTCHSNGWATMDKTLADTDGDGEADTEISTNSTPKNVETSWGTTNSHGKDSSSNSLLEFKNATLDNQPLFHTDHDALVCSQCHNPHASNNAKLIIEKVGETLVVEQIVKQVDNTEESKYAVVDPQTTEYFDDLKFAGIVKGNYTNYDLSNETSLMGYINLHVNYIDNGTVETVRKQQASLCAACHEGTNYYSSVNGLGLAINMNLHNKNSRCSSCHKHDGNVF
jgi:predicted CXXCH cytochrome family protein